MVALALVCAGPLTVAMATTEAAAAPAAAAPAGAVQTGAAHWQVAWAAADQAVPAHPDAPARNRAPLIEHRTVRQIVQPHVSGRIWRVRVSNLYGRTPVTLTRATLARAGTGAAVMSGTVAPLSFGGKTSLTLRPGEERFSDPAEVNLPAGAPMAISFYLDGAALPTNWHKTASQVAFLSAPGDHSADIEPKAFKAGPTSYLWLNAVDRRAAASPGEMGETGETGGKTKAAEAGAIVAIGDSITDGMRSSLNANHRWPDYYAERLLRTPGREQFSVVNLGISGNRLLSDSECYGERLGQRFERDALRQSGVGAVIVLIGINDIDFAGMAPRRGLDCDAPHTQVSAADLISGYRRLVQAAHATGLPIYLATLMPTPLPAKGEAIRQQVNRWIRSAESVDGVIDFDSVMRDPARPERLLARLDSGDHEHPNDAGYRAMAEAVPLALRRSSGGPARPHE